jgi:ferric-dicitrate binding protein FerR (iron transport regulator)
LLAITEPASSVGYIYISIIPKRFNFFQRMEENIDRQYMIELADRWLKGTITPEEELEFAAWYNQFSDDKELNIDTDFADRSEALRQRIYDSLVKVLANEEPVAQKHAIRMIWRRYLIAASVLVLLGTAAYLVMRPKSSRHELAAKQAPGRDMAPGHDGAILTLAGGRRIVLDSAANGTVAAQGNMQVIKQNGRVTYKAATTGQTNADPTSAGPTTAQPAPAISYNTMTTPRGRQFQLVLPDGSMVWLNAASSITYPTAFTGAQREVEITGEAYFEVVHKEKQPFRVKMGNILVEDLGTHFNINAYPDDPAQWTTLLEGSVRVSGYNGAVLLKPGQQVRSEGLGPVEIRSDVDLDATMAWKNGNLSLQNADVKAIFRQISRWYDMDVRYEGSLPKTQFWGIIGRNVYLSNVLHVLEANGIYTRIKGNVIIVSATKPNQTDTVK